MLEIIKSIVKNYGYFSAKNFFYVSVLTAKPKKESGGVFVAKADEGKMNEARLLHTRLTLVLDGIYG